jgi:CDP-glucose 4,6-dehydratase
MEDLDMTPFGGVYLRRRVLVTGHTGFKGSWLTYWLRELGADVAGLARDPDTSPSHWHLLEMQEVADYRVDLRDAEAVSAVLRKHRPELVFHLAAQPLVRRSYREPVATFESNVMGLINLLEAVRNCDSVRVLVNATTDKVYAEQPETSGYREHDPLGASDPYSTSKACAELISECWQCHRRR